MNCILQIAIGINYIHKRGIIHQSLIPDNIFVENDRILKVGNMALSNMVMGKMSKNFSVGGSPEYWSSEQGYIFDNIKERAREGNYLPSMKLLPAITLSSDVYQLALIIV